MTVVLDYAMRPSAIEELRRAMRRAAGSSDRVVWQDTMDSLVWLSMWLADRGMERERESIHKLHACLLAVGLDAEPHDLEPHPEEAGACLLPAQKPDMAGLWAQVVHRGYALRNILRGRARVRALAACLAEMAERGRELAWCVGTLVLMGTMELDPCI